MSQLEIRIGSVCASVEIMGQGRECKVRGEESLGTDFEDSSP